jgi:lysophospholipase L1-like esterase
MSREYRMAAGVLGITLVISLLLCEVAVRVFDLGPEISVVYWENYRVSDNPKLGYELVPGSKDGTNLINRDGMRDRERAARKPPNTIRIACIGDSICYGLEVSREEAFPARLESDLNAYYSASGTTVEVLNFGVTGYNLTQTIENLKTRALKYDPDIIIYAYCLNEPQEYSFELASLKAMMTSAERQYIDRHWSRSIVRSHLITLARYAMQSKSASGQKEGEAPVLKKDDKVWSSFYGGSYPQYFASLYADKNAWGSIEQGLSELGAISRRESTPVFVAIFPVLMHFNNYPLRKIHNQVAQASRKHALEVIDLLDVMRLYESTHKTRVGWDALHPNKEGHGVVATALLMDLINKDPLSKLEKPERMMPAGSKSIEPTRP